MNFVDKDILTVSTGIICHQVNTKGIMGAGLALAVKTKYPGAYYHYKTSRLRLGRVLLSRVDNRLWIAHLIAQESFGPGVQTDYDAFRSSIRHLHQVQTHLHKVQDKELRDLGVYLPYKIGCGLAGGDWDTVLAIIEEELPDATICVLKSE